MSQKLKWESSKKDGVSGQNNRRKPKTNQKHNSWISFRAGKIGVAVEAFSQKTETLITQSLLTIFLIFNEVSRKSQSEVGWEVSLGQV